MTKISEIVKLDDRGRIVIPGSARKILNLPPGAKLLMNVDSEANQILLTPFLGSDTKPIRMIITMNDKSGALASIATAISELGINLILGEAHIIRKGVNAEWSIVADLGTAKKDLTLEEIKEKVLASGGAVDIEFKEFK